MTDSGNIPPDDLKELLLTMVTKLNVLTAMTNPEDRQMQENLLNRDLLVHKLAMELYAVVDEATIKWVHPMLYPTSEDSE